MKPVPRILFAIKNTSARRHTAVEKAIRIAKSLRASLELFNAISTPVFLEVQPLSGPRSPRASAKRWRCARSSSKSSRSAPASTAWRPRDRRFGIFRRTKPRRHLLRGDAAHVIPKAARQLGAAVVVMGAVSRSGLRRVFIGNTAERVLETLPRDVLVVKPPHVTRPVARRPRGMRVVAPSPISRLPV